MSNANLTVARADDYDRISFDMVFFEFAYEGTPTNPFYTVDYDDGSVVENPKFLASRSISMIHLFKEARIYNVKFTVLNKVSSVSRSVQVKVLNRFIDFVCVPKWRAFEVAAAKEYEYSSENGVYLVSSDYELRLHCTWKSRFDLCFLMFLKRLNYLY